MYSQNLGRVYSEQTVDEPSLKQMSQREESYNSQVLIQLASFSSEGRSNVTQGTNVEVIVSSIIQYFLDLIILNIKEYTNLFYPTKYIVSCPSNNSNSKYPGIRI